MSRWAWSTLPRRKALTAPAPPPRPPGAPARVPPRRLAEHPGVLAAELRRAPVPHPERRDLGPFALLDHQPPRFEQPEPLLVLHRAHRGRLLEPTEERRPAGHPLVRASASTSIGASRAARSWCTAWAIRWATLPARTSSQENRRAVRPLQEMEQQLAVDQGREDRAVFGAVEQLRHPQRSLEEPVARRTDEQRSPAIPRRPAGRAATQRRAEQPDRTRASDTAADVPASPRSPGWSPAGDRAEDRLGRRLPPRLPLEPQLLHPLGDDAERRPPRPLSRGWTRETRMQDTPATGDGWRPSAGQAWAIRRASRSAAVAIPSAYLGGDNQASQPRVASIRASNAESSSTTSSAPS